MKNSKTTYIRTLRDWEELLSAVVDNTESLKEAEDLRVLLEQLMTQARALKARQDSFTANRQRLTQELGKVLVEGREVAMRIRGLVKFRLGPKNEQIVQFGMAPLRKRSRGGKGAEPAAPDSPPGAIPPPKGGEAART